MLATVHVGLEFWAKKWHRKEVLAGGISQRAGCRTGTREKFVGLAVVKQTKVTPSTVADHWPVRVSLGQALRQRILHERV